MQVKEAAEHGYSAVQVGVSDAKVKNVTKPLRCHFEKAGVAPKRKVMEFRVKPEALLPVGKTHAPITHAKKKKKKAQSKANDLCFFWAKFSFDFHPASPPPLT